MKRKQKTKSELKIEIESLKYESQIEIDLLKSDLDSAYRRLNESLKILHLSDLNQYYKPVLSREVRYNHDHNEFMTKIVLRMVLPSEKRDLIFDDDELPNFLENPRNYGTKQETESLIKANQ